MIALYHDVCHACSRLITRRYSTSFSMGIRAFAPELRIPIYAIYGFVRFADEIVDTFHEQDKAVLLERFSQATYRAIDERISLNPVLHAFQRTVNRYGIEKELIQAFLDSMAMDLETAAHDQASYDTYIYGSAEVVGLMCLRVFTYGDEAAYQQMLPHARSLGSAFQKVNFLRDMRSDHQERGRVYFPDVDFTTFTEAEKDRIQEDVARDFEHAYEGIRMLPKGARFGVYVAYVYYLQLFRKICCAPVQQVQQQRIRIHNGHKLWLLAGSVVRNRFNLI